MFSIGFIKSPDILTVSNGRMVGILQKHQLSVVCQGVCNLKIIQEWKKAFTISKVQVINKSIVNDHIFCSESFCFFKHQHLLVTQSSFFKR